MTSTERAAPPPKVAEAESSASVMRRRHFGHEIGFHVSAWVMRAFFRLYARWRVLGTENIPRTGAIIFAANHTSYLDPPLGWAALYGVRRMCGVAKQELWKNGLTAFWLTCIEAIPVKRGSADRAMLRRALEILERGGTVGIFPEGYRSFDGKLNPGQPGVALLVQKSGAAVVPVGIHGAYAMLPRGAKKLRRAQVTLLFGNPMSFAPDAPREQIAAQVMEAIAALLTEHGFPTDPPGPERAARPPEEEN